MGSFEEIEGDLIKLALAGEFDVIAHGCNCHCVMGAGIAPQMARAFGADNFPKEGKEFRGDINKLGTIDYKKLVVLENGSGVVDYGRNWVGKELTVVNAYTQYNFDASTNPVDYAAIELCFKKMNKEFAGKTIGLPLIGCGLAGGSWSIVKKLMQGWLYDCNVVVVHYKP